MAYTIRSLPIGVAAHTPASRQQAATTTEETHRPTDLQIEPTNHHRLEPNCKSPSMFVQAPNTLWVGRTDALNIANAPVVVQDLVTQWTQSYSCENKNSQETEKSPRKILKSSPSRKLFARQFIRIWQILSRIDKSRLTSQTCSPPSRVKCAGLSVFVFLFLPSRLRANRGDSTRRQKEVCTEKGWGLPHHSPPTSLCIGPIAPHIMHETNFFAFDNDSNLCKLKGTNLTFEFLTNSSPLDMTFANFGSENFVSLFSMFLTTGRVAHAKEGVG